MNLPDFLVQDRDGYIHLAGHRIGVRHVVFDLFYSLADQVETGSVAEFIDTMERFTREIQPRL